MKSNKTSNQKQNNATKKARSSRSKVDSGDVVTFHLPINLTLTGVNLKQINILTNLSVFDQAPSLAAKYLRYRVRNVSWRFYCNVPVAFQQATNTIFPPRVYEVPMDTQKVPAIAVSDYLNYAGVRTYTFTRDIVGSGKPYSPIDGTLAGDGEWKQGVWYPTSKL